MINGREGLRNCFDCQVSFSWVLIAWICIVVFPLIHSQQKIDSSKNLNVFIKSQMILNISRGYFREGNFISKFLPNFSCQERGKAHNICICCLSGVKEPESKFHLRNILHHFLIHILRVCFLSSFATKQQKIRLKNFISI